MRSRLWLAPILLFSILACRLVAGGPAEPAPSGAPGPVSTAAGPPTWTPEPSASPVPVETLAAGLQAELQAALPPTPTPDSSGYSSGIDAVAVLPLTVPAGFPPLWVAYSLGSRAFEPLQNHFVAIYTRGPAGWDELGRLELDGPDYVSAGAVSQERVEPGHIWLAARGGAGAHSGCFSLLVFDGAALRQVAFNCATSPDGGELQDLNGDGFQEVLLNASDNYVFCYACGVRLYQYEVWHWDGAQLAPVRLTRLAAPAPAGLVEVNNRAVELAEAGLWKAAQARIHQAQALDPQDRIVAWNVALVDLTAGRRLQAAAGSPYPLLAYIFFGDYARALEPVLPYTPAEIFRPGSALIAGTVAEGWEPELAGWLRQFTDRALAVQPDLAEAYFFRAWGSYLSDPASPLALADLERAAQLDPHQALYASALQYLQAGP